MRSLTTSAHRHFRKTALSLAISLAISPVALANPLGPSVVNGTASFATNGNTFTVTNSPGAIINWQQFNIGQNEITKFVQQNAQSAVLNRIGGQDPSQILGTLQSNGRVFLVNPNGVLFGTSAIIDVAGLIASSLNISNADFLANRLNFEGVGGSVGNLGRITTPVGGSVYLIGGKVSNEGIITTPQGQVLLAAGNSVSLTDTGTPNMTVTLNATDNRAVNLGQITAQGGRIDIYGALIDQQGSLAADSASVDAQGRIVLKASATTTLGGSLSVANTGGQGGRVEVLGDQVTLTGNARVDASGATGGGTVLIGGDWQGKNPALQNATNTTLEAGARIQADATQSGNGGKVIVWSNDKTFYDAFISARGGAQGGDGGFVETSGHTLTASGLVDARAPFGKNGTWLLDPAFGCISDGSSCTVPGLSAPIPVTQSVSTLGQALGLADVIVDITDVAAYQTSSTYVVPAIPGLGANSRLLRVNAPYIYLNGSLDALTNNINLDTKFDAFGASASLPNKSGVIDIASGGHSLRTAGAVYLDASKTVNIAPDADFRANYITIFAEDYFSYSPAGGTAGFWGATSSTVFGSIHAPYVALGGTYSLPTSQIDGTGAYFLNISAYGGGSTGVTSATYPSKSGVLELLPNMAWTMPNTSGWKGDLILQGSQSLVLGAGARIVNGSPATVVPIDSDLPEAIIELNAPQIVNNGASFQAQVVDVGINSLSGSPISIEAYAAGLGPAYYSSSKNILLGTDTCAGDWCISDAGKYISGTWQVLGFFSHLNYGGSAGPTVGNLDVVGPFNSRSQGLWLAAAGKVTVSSPLNHTGYIALMGGDEWGSAYTSSMQRGVTINQPVKSDAGVILGTSGGTVQLNSTVTAPGVSIYLEPNCTDGSLNCASPVQAGFVNNAGAQALVTSKGWLIENATGGATVNLGGMTGQGPVSLAEAQAQGVLVDYVPMSSSDTYYLAKGSAAPLPTTPTEPGTSTAETITTDVCVNNATLCATTSSQMTSQTAQVVETATTEGTETKGVVTYDAKANGKDAKKTAKAEEKEDEKSSGKGEGKETAKTAVRPKDAVKEADERKSSAELKQEAKQATAAAKKTEAEVKKTEAEAKKTEAEVKKAEVEVKKTEAEAKKAETVAKKAEDDGKKAAADAKQAETEAKSAKNPEHKAAAESKKAEAESRKAESESKQAEAGAKKAEVSAKKAEMDAKQAEAEGKRVEVGAKKAEADAKKAEAEYKQAAAEAKEAKTPEQKASAEKRAEEKRIESVQKQAEAKVKLAKAEERKSESEQKKVEASAHKVEAEAKQTEAEAKRDESSAHKAEAAAKQDESREVRAKTEGKAEDAKRAENRKVESEQKRATEEKKAETKHAEAEGRKAEASKLKAEAETKRAEHTKKAETQRAETLKAFQKAAIASMTPERLAEMSALRHEFKTELLKPALNILQSNPGAANLPPCGGGSDVCVPARQELAAQAAQIGQVSMPVPTLSFLPQIQRKVAVMVGVNNYQDNRIPALESAVPDVEAVGKVLQEKMGYDVRVIRNGTRAEIVKALNAVGKEVGANDSVTIYYAGHGYQMETAKGGNQGYWLPADASVSDPSNWVSNSDVAKLLGNIPAKQVMLVSDSCYSGAFTKEQKVAPSTDAQQILSKRSVVVMSSGGEEPVSDEGNDGHSIFAWSLMNSLKNVGKFDPGTKVFEDTRASVIESFPQVPQYGAATSAGHSSGGDYLFEVRSFK